MRIDQAPAEQAQASFETFVAAQQAGLLRFGWLLTGDHERSQDLAQDALVRVFPHWDRISARGRPGAYVRQVMLNLNRSWWRRGLGRGESRLDDEIAAGASAPEDIDRLNDRLDLLQALRRLPAGQRAVVVLRYYEGYAEAEVAQILGCRVGTVKSQAARGLTKLRAYIPSGHVAARTGQNGGMTP